MKKKIRVLYAVAVVSVFVCVGADLVWAAGDKYPTGSISNVCLFGPGGQADLFNRVLSKHLEKYLGVPVVTLNKPGGGGAIGFSFLVNSRPDGHTIGVGTVENIIVPTLAEGKPPYSVKDLFVLGQIATVYNVLCVAADSPWKTFQEFLDYARKNPGVKFGSPGIRSTLYLRMETLNRNANLKMVGVPFDSDAEQKTALLGKHIPVGIWDLGGSRELAAAGKIRILFIFEPPVSAGLDPNTPSLATAIEKSVAEKDIDISHCLVVSANTPDDVKQRLKRTLEQIVKDPEFVADMKKMELMINYVDGDIVMQKKIPLRLDQVRAFYKEMGWLK